VAFVHAAPFMQAARDPLTSRAFRTLMSVGRLRPAIELDYARSVLTIQASRLAAQYPDTNGTTGITVRPTSRSRFFPTRWATTVRFLASLMGLCGLVLLLSCCNVATLLLVRATLCERDIAVRMAIGASRRRIALRGLVEVGALLVIGTALGLVVALAFPRLLAAYQAPGAGLPLWNVDLSIDARVLTLTGGVSILTSLAAGLVPVLASATRSPASILSSSGRRLAGTRLGRA
jgi:putative ABC transport system permease protein